MAFAIARWQESQLVTAKDVLQLVTDKCLGSAYRRCWPQFVDTVSFSYKSEFFQDVVGREAIWSLLRGNPVDKLCWMAVVLLNLDPAVARARKLAGRQAGRQASSGISL